MKLSNRAVILIEGADASAFLQGIITNDIHKATEKGLLYAMMLSPQGKFLYDFFILKIDGGYLLDCQAQKRDEIIKKLSIYKLRSQVNITAATFNVYVSPAKVDADFLPDPRNANMGYRAIRKDEPPIHSGDSHEYETKRMALLIPDADKDFIYDKSFPLEFGANELNAIDYAKGCYIGQEPIARIHHRGMVRKRLFLIKASNLNTGDEIKSVTGEKIGIMLGIINDMGLGLINVEDMQTYGKPEMVL